jgi:hypothetical protein
MTTLETLQALNDANAILATAHTALYREKAVQPVREKVWHAMTYIAEQAAALLAE